MEVVGEATVQAKAKRRKGIYIGRAGSRRQKTRYASEV